MATGQVSGADELMWQRWRAVADLYHACFTGLALTFVSRRSVADATEFMFRVFRKQQQERFLPGLKKLGLDRLPPAVAAAQYHYLSNWIGGVHVEYMYESDRKAWIRYPPPRWIWRGTAICGIPSQVSRAMLQGWHANNGMSLGLPSMGFVCTKQTVDGQDGLEGYYYDYGHAIEPEQWLVFARHEEAPPFDPAKAPVLPVDSWPRARLEKAYRNYAMEYVKTASVVAVQMLGPDEGGHLLHLTGKLIGMQHYDEVAAAFGTTRGDAGMFADFACAMLDAQGDPASYVTRDGALTVVQKSLLLLDDVPDAHAASARLLEGLMQGLAAGCGRGISVLPATCWMRGQPLRWIIKC